MGQSFGFAPSTDAPLDALREEHERLELERDTLRLREEVQRLDTSRRTVMEGWGDFVDPREYLRDDPNFGTPVSPMDIIGNREDGMFRPIFETEQQLAAIRGQCRFLAAKNPA